MQYSAATYPVTTLGKALEGTASPECAKVTSINGITAGNLLNGLTSTSDCKIKPLKAKHLKSKGEICTGYHYILDWVDSALPLNESCRMQEFLYSLT